MVPNLSGIINPAGAITGYFFVPPTFSFARGFVRDHKGSITIFDLPNGCQEGQGTFATGINPAGLVVGDYTDATCEGHGFLRFPNGTFINIDVPGAVATTAEAINPAGAISGVGFTNDAIIGYSRSPSGRFTTYSFPENGQFGVIDNAINPAGDITGSYSDGVTVHGYLWTPR
jgi:hypothetical protein